jgi:glycerol-3-phosphate acyltransferase PlsY
VVVAALDVAKGFVALWLARRFGGTDWATVTATVAVVAGHCWPCFAGFRGGVGLSAAGGALLAIYPLGFVLGLGLAAAGTLLLRHGARSNVIGGLLFGPLIWLVSHSAALAFAGGGAGLIVAIRASRDWNRVYREVWLDRDHT